MNNLLKPGLLVLAMLAGGLSSPAAAQEATVQSPAAGPTESVATKPITFKPFRRGITQTVQLPPDLQNLRRKLIAGKGLRTTDLRALADAGDSLAQLRFAKQLSDMGDPSLVRAQVHYYAMAAYNGRDGAVQPMLSLLRTHSVTLDVAVLGNAETALLAQAAHGQIDAIAGLAKFYVAGVPFGPKQQEGLEMLARVANAGDYQAALDLALQLIGTRPDGSGMEQARQYLEIAANSPELAIRTVALSLLNTGGEI